jgi:hypothetical protein
MQSVTQEPALSLYNAMGKLVFEGQMNNGRITLDLGGQPEGLYIIKVKAGGNIFTSKVSLSCR